ncbi:Heat shock cognate 71 kDa protein, partial [Orchesella cincta]
MNSQDQPAIGIDLGTTYCCTAIYAKGKVHVVRNGIGKNTTPSYVAFNIGKEIVGDAAKRQAFSNPENTIFDAKRIIGRKFGDPKLQEDMRLWPFSVVDEQGIPKIAVGDRNLHPEEISAKLLKQLKLDAEAYLGEKVTKAVITVPAYFTDGQRQATIDAGTMAGLNVLSIIAEPTAAALAYKLQHSFENRERNVLIFDLGGGTFDVVVMRTSKGKIDVLAVDGDTHLGGEDFDKKLMEHCAVEFKKQHNIDLFDGKDSKSKQEKDEARRKLKRLQGECEKRKVELAAARLAEVNVDNMHGDIDLSVMVTRNTFEELNATLFQKTIKIASAKLDKSRIDDVVLVGGSTRIPKIQELLQNYFGGKTLDCSINPDEAVAYGAAMHAAMLNGLVGKDSAEYEEIQDVAPMSIGLQMYGGGFSVIIPKSTKTPVKAKERYRRLMIIRLVPNYHLSGGR